MNNESKVTASTMEKEAAFGGLSSQPSYSSFSHIRELSNLSFAVGLREDPENAQLFVSKILPMCQIIPGIAVERTRRREQNNAEVEEEIDVESFPEIKKLRQQLALLYESNKQLEHEMKRAETRLSDASANFEAIEKRSQTIFKEIEDLEEQLGEERNRTLGANLDAQSVQQSHQELQEQAKAAEINLSKLQTELEKKQIQLESVLACSDIEIIFCPHDAATITRNTKSNVKNLGPHNESEHQDIDQVRRLDSRFPKSKVTLSRHTFPRDSRAYEQRILDYKRKSHTPTSISATYDPDQNTLMGSPPIHRKNHEALLLPRPYSPATLVIPPRGQR